MKEEIGIEEFGRADIVGEEKKEVVGRLRSSLKGLKSARLDLELAFMKIEGRGKEIEGSFGGSREGVRKNIGYVKMVLENRENELLKELERMKGVKNEKLEFKREELEKIDLEIQKIEKVQNFQKINQ